MGPVLGCPHLLNYSWTQNPSTDVSDTFLNEANVLRLIPVVDP